MNPNPKCPGCEGKGIAIQQYDPEIDGYKVIGIEKCALCSCDFDEIYKYIDKLILETSGKQITGMSLEEQDLCFLGEDGQKYRRLLNWLWAHPPDSGQDKNGFSNNKAYREKPTKSFDKLFSFEKKIKFKNKPKSLDHPDEFLRPWFTADVKSLLEEFKRLVKTIDKHGRIPIIHYVKIQPTPNSIILNATDLELWTEGECHTQTFNLIPGTVHGRTVLDILKTCDKKGTVLFAYEIDENMADPSFLVIKHENSTWKLPTFSVLDYPIKPEEITRKSDAA